MFPTRATPWASPWCFLCMRRDVSEYRTAASWCNAFSLHAQRCFWHHQCFWFVYSVFSVCAEMFPMILLMERPLLCFLCMRRDVSSSTTSSIADESFSLHAQRCFLWKIEVILSLTVFSACAEMFLFSWSWRLQEPSILCMRRDVSVSLLILFEIISYSLHAQRCFLWCYSR